VFREATIGKIVHVEVPSPNHLYWPELDIDLEVESILFPNHIYWQELDVDLEVESILFPERYPLVCRR
jgi:hypothetical protein